MKSRFILTISKETIINYLLAIITFILACYASPTLFLENGPFEMVQSVIMLVGFIFCVIEYKKGRNFKHFFLACGFILLICVGRELSWGRIFFTDEAGQLISRKNWFLGPYIYYIVGPFILACLVYMYKTKFISNGFTLLKKAPIMIYDFALMIIMIFVAELSEKHYLVDNNHHLSISLEEAAETIAYLSIVIIIRAYSKNNLLAKVK